MRLKTHSGTENVFLNTGLTFCKEQNGENFAFGMHGAPEAINGVYLTLYNSGATNGELQDNGNADFAYCWLNPANFAYYLAKWELASLQGAGRLSKADRVTSARQFEALKLKWLRFFANIPREWFVPTGILPVEGHEVGATDGTTAYKGEFDPANDADREQNALEGAEQIEFVAHEAKKLHMVCNGHLCG